MKNIDDAARAFRDFFQELQDAFLEREALLNQIQLALLCREHVLVTGPPGTAKSAVAASVLGRICDEETGRPSLFAKQISELTVQTDLIGAVDFKVLTETGRTEYLTDEGMLGATHAFLDEVFDGRDMLLRSILNVLHERELKHGMKVTPGRTECVIMTSNRYLAEVLARSPELLLAFADRLSFICFVPKAFARPQSRAAMLARANAGQKLDLRARLSLQELDVLQAAVEEVEVSSRLVESLESLVERLEKALWAQVSRLPDYVPTKYFSHRSVVKALWALKAAVVLDRIWHHPDRDLLAHPRDLDALRAFFLLGGPPEEELDLLAKAAVDPREKAQLEILRVEHRAFDAALAEVLADTAGGAARELPDLGVKEDFDAAEAQVRSYHSETVLQLARRLRAGLNPGPRHPENRAQVLAAGRMLVNAVQTRLSRGISGQGEGRGGILLHRSLRAGLDLCRAVPELSSRIASLTGPCAQFCRQALQMIALSAEGAELEDGISLEQVAALAQNLDEELDGVHALVSFLKLNGEEGAGDLEALETRTRDRAAQALRRRAERELGATALGRAANLDEALTTASRRLAELEQALTTLSPTLAGMKQDLLGPLGGAYARELLGSAEFNRTGQLSHAVSRAAERLRQEGLDPEPILAGSRELIDERLRSHARGLAKGLRAPALTRDAALNGVAYNRYRQEFHGWAPEGEVRGLLDLESALGADASGSVIPRVAADIKEAVASAELSAVKARVAYLEAWLDQVLEVLPDPGALARKDEADRAFDRLIQSRFPLVTLKEGELVRLSGALAPLAGMGGEVGEGAASLGKELEDLSSRFGTWSQRLLDVRARL